MISEDIKNLINITENFIAINDSEQEFTRNIKNLGGMLKSSNVNELQATLPAQLANNGSGIASEIANRFANAGQKLWRNSLV